MSRRSRAAVRAPDGSSKRAADPRPAFHGERAENGHSHACRVSPATGRGPAVAGGTVTALVVVGATVTGGIVTDGVFADGVETTGRDAARPRTVESTVCGTGRPTNAATTATTTMHPRRNPRRGTSAETVANAASVGQ